MATTQKGITEGRAWMYAIALGIAVARPMIATRPVSWEGSYQAVAHLFVGALFGAYFARNDRACLWLAVALSALELICFFFVR